ncbi:hypothetical protein A8C56_18410 [Niabella ginsenosidivorans]|uniref:Uncharacterized protein n=1 Tax=Niabella ginsenosidivorans TaxID=1176587 RepID=A0A1A9I4X3_9BACT|nr:hypothetical protein [Niabella ginsenosidivorans]ANH82686.1 hypothetical protein A8C56_18410 [Niabella ginsenosidivorans]
MGKVIKCKFDTGAFATNPFMDNLFRGDVKKGDTISIKEGSRMKFYVDASCFDDAVVSTETKWAFIYDAYYKEGSTNQYNSLWADISGSSGSNTPSNKAPDVGELLAKEERNKPVAALGIGTQYKTGTEFVISPAGTSFYYGFKQRVVVFTNDPEQEFYFFVIPYTDPNITYAYFDKNIRPFRFGDIVSLTICLHQYPDYVVGSKSYFANIYLMDKDEAAKFPTRKNTSGVLEDQTDELTDADLFEGKHKKVKLTASTRSNNINTYLTFNFPLTLEWRDSGKKQRYFVPVVEIFEVEKGMIFDSDKIVDYRNFAEMPSSGLQQYDQKLIGIETVETYKDQPNSEILVEYETTDEILSRVEREKGEMIQYIGDIQYTRKEHNPCAYSMISVKEGQGMPVIIFDEFKLKEGVDDKTDKTVFCIIAGEKEKKEVTVTAKYKKNVGAPEESIHIGSKYKCEQILNDGKDHSSSEEVFKMNWIVGQMRPSKETGFYIENFLNYYQPNPLAPSNASKAGILNPVAGKKQYKDDQEAKGVSASKADQAKYQAVTVAGVQGLQKKDYTINGDSITLRLGYYFYKTYDNEVLDYLATQEYLEGGIVSDNFKNIWIVRYLLKLIKKEELAQTYFVPVTTCRYPNQLALIKAYPSMKWVINFNYNIETPVYYAATTALTEHYSGFNEGRVVTSNNNTRKNILNSLISNGLQPYVGRETTFGLYVECEVGSGNKIVLGDEFGKKFRKILSPILWVINKLDGDMQVSEARRTEARLRVANSGLLGRLNKLPMSFSLEPPKVGVGVGIKAVSQNGMITYELDGHLIADPLLGANVKLDLLVLGSKFKPWGAIIDALDLASWLSNVVSGGRLEFTYEFYFQLSAQIKLVGNDSQKETATNARVVYNFASRKFSGTIALQGYLEGKIQMSALLKVKVKAENGKDMTQYRTEDNDKKAAEFGIEVTAKSFVTITIGKDFGMGAGKWGADFYFSGVQAFIKVKAGFKGLDDDLKLIPHVNKKIDLIKGEVND